MLFPLAWPGSIVYRATVPAQSTLYAQGAIHVEREGGAPCMHIYMYIYYTYIHTYIRDWSTVQTHYIIL
jgi:hypothetical protein